MPACVRTLVGSCGARVSSLGSRRSAAGSGTPTTTRADRRRSTATRGPCRPPRPASTRGRPRRGAGVTMAVRVSRTPPVRVESGLREPTFSEAGDVPHPLRAVETLVSAAGGNRRGPRSEHACIREQHVPCSRFTSRRDRARPPRSGRPLRRRGDRGADRRDVVRAERHGCRRDVLLSRCRRRLVPGIGTTFGSAARSRASASCAGEQPATRRMRRAWRRAHCCARGWRR